MKNVQPAIVSLGKLDGCQGRLKTGLLIPDSRMIRGDQLPPFLPQPLQVTPDDLLILAVRGNQHFAVPKEPVEGEVIVDQQVAGGRSHEDLEPAYVLLFLIR